MKSQASRTAIVTGAARRIGASLASALVSDGWTVLAHVRREDDAVPDGCAKVVADLAAEDCADRIFDAADPLPPVRLLVNNAARFAFDDLGGFDPKEFNAHMAVNVQAPVQLIERFTAAQAEGEDALVVNIVDSKLAAPNPDYLSYT